MKKIQALVIFGIFSLSILLSSPLSTKAEEPFGATVKIIGYDHLLNGQLLAVAEGSGTLIDQDGTVLTNAHVIMNDELGKPLDVFSICVVDEPQNPPECRFTASLERYNEKIDLALLKIDEEAAWGTAPSPFPYLSYSHGLEPVDGDKVTVKGFPGSGGITIHSTQGQISGFEQYNGYTYLKTDADIDAGNSGGTMLDAEGNFIGIPSYVVSNLETSGRALHISDAKEWIDSENGETASENTGATERLRSDLKQGFEAKEAGTINYKEAPGFSVTAPEGWEFSAANETSVTLYKLDSSSILQGNIINMGFKSKLSSEEKLALYRHALGEFYPEEEIKDINGKEVLHLWQKDTTGTYHILAFYHGYHEVMLTYFVPKDDVTETEKGVEAFVESIKFSSPDEDNPISTTNLNEKAYPFTYQMPNAEWRIVKNEMIGPNLAIGGRNNDYLETLRVYYSELPENVEASSPQEGLEYALENFLPYDSKVTFQSSELKVDGLLGWIYIYEFSEGNKKMKTASVTILDPEYELYFEYEAEEVIFEDGFVDFIASLKNFKSKRYTEEIKPEWNGMIKVGNKGQYNIPTPKPVTTVNLTDIVGHRYEQNIRNLVTMGVIHGNPDGTFKPEDFVNRAAALKIILQSLRAKQTENRETPYVMPANFNKFPDVTPDLWYATYVAEGLDKGIIEGYPDGTFKGANNVILAEALKMALEAHDANIWNGTTEPWYKKYFDTAYQLSLLPQDLQDPAKPLTRAELAYIVDQLVTE